MPGRSLKGSRHSHRYEDMHFRQCKYPTETKQKVLKITLNDRKSRWKQFRRLISARARVQFFYLLSERGFRGDLLLNHNERKLDLRVRDTYRYDGLLAFLCADAKHRAI